MNGALEESDGDAEAGTQDTSIYSNNKVILNANGVENPMIPTAAGIGGEVIVACTECQKVYNSN